MPIIKMRDVVTQRGVTQASSQEQYLDTDSGHVFDAAGNTLARMEVRDDETTQMLADYAHDIDLEMSASSLSRFNPYLASQMLSARTTGAEAPMLMDLGVSDVHIPSAMPNMALGYSNFSGVADLIAPPVPVMKQTDKYFVFGKEDAFQRALPITGAAGAQVGEVSPRLSNTSYGCIERALGGFVSTEMEANQDAPLQIRQATVRRIVQAMKLEREIRVAGLVRTSANWNSGNVVTITGGNQWNGGATSDPVKDIHGILDLSWGEVTGLVLAGKTQRGYSRNPAVRAYYGFKPVTELTPDKGPLAVPLQLPPFYPCDMRYVASDGTLAQVWGNDVVVFRNPPEMPPKSGMDTATAYTMRWSNAPTPDGTASGGFIVRQYFVQDRGGLGGNKIVCINYDAEVLTSKYIGGLLINAYQ